MKQHNYFVYITTNESKTVLYVGFTNNLSQRLTEHFINKGKPSTFAGRYYCYHLIHFERFQYVQHAMAREKQIKGWLRAKKIDLLEKENPQWDFLNDEIMECHQQTILRFAQNYNRGSSIAMTL